MLSLYIKRCILIYLSFIVVNIRKQHQLRARLDSLLVFACLAEQSLGRLVPLPPTSFLELSKFLLARWRGPIQLANFGKAGFAEPGQVRQHSETSKHILNLAKLCI